ncbi:MAG: glycosyltransferase [Pirellulales bacterium]|nr:glycosyltransferase [Pirellulales bacterium]
MTPRILHLLPMLDRSGAEKQLGLLAAGLMRAGFDAHVCALASAGTTPEMIPLSGIRPTILERRWMFDPRALWNLKRLVDGLRPDAIHAWGGAANGYGLAAVLGGGAKRFFASYRSMEPVESWMQARLDRQIGRRAACLAANGGSVKDLYVRNGLPEEKFQIISNAVELPGPPTCTRRQILDELGLPGDSRLIGLVGRLLPHKRVKDAIWAADLLKVVRKDVHLLIFGDGPHRGRLRRFRDQVRIGGHVHFLGFRDDLDRFLPHFDLLWSTGAYESQSNAILEAMAACVPVVASDIPGTRELVHNQTGLLVRVGDRAGFARGASRLLEDAALARRLGQAARDRAAGEFTVEKMVGEYIEMYNRLI